MAKIFTKTKWVLLLNLFGKGRSKAVQKCVISPLPLNLFLYQLVQSGDSFISFRETLLQIFRIERIQEKVMQNSFLKKNKGDRQNCFT